MIMGDYMVETINQCCYTHIGTWTAIAQKGNFEQKYIGELSRHSTLPGPEYNNDLSVFETVGYGDKFLVMRTQYGLKDHTTETVRASMFSHGYLIDVGSDKFDPNVFLTLSKENFCTDVASAQAERTGFLRSDKFTLRGAMETAGLTQETYAKLIKCVYQMAMRSIHKQSLIIKSENDEQSTALLYCIYAALLPRYARHLSSASTSYNFSDMRKIVFSKEINSSKKYFVPETGDNNVLSANIEKKLDSLYFVDYGVKNFDTAEKIQEYYSELEKTVTKISDTKQVDDDLLKLAHIMTADPEPSRDSDIVSDDDTLMSVLKFVAEYNTNENELIKQYLEKLRAEAIRRGLIKLAPAKPEAVEEKTIVDNGLETGDTIVKNADGSIPFADNNIGRPPVSVDNYRPAAYNSAASKQSNSTGRDPQGNPFYGNINSPDRGNPSANVFSGNIDRLPPLSVTEKQKMRNNLEKCAKGGPQNISVLKNRIEQIVRQERVITDIQSKDEYARMFYDVLWLMIRTGIRQIKAASFSNNPILLFESWCNSLGLPQSNIEWYKYQLIIQYWQSFKWENFDLMKRNDYGYFRIDERFCADYPETNKKLIAKSSFVNCLIGLVANNVDFVKPEDWLREFNKICCEYRSNYDPNKVKKVIRPYYVKYIVANESPSSFFKDEYVREKLVDHAIVLKETEFNKFISIWSYIYASFRTPEKVSKKEKDSIEEKFLATFKSYILTEYASPEIKKWVYKQTYDFLVYFDKRGDTVPFDYWLVLGSTNPDSPYRIFYDEEYEYHPMILDKPASEIIGGSRFLEDDYYRDILLNNERKNKSGFIRKLIKEIEDGNTGHLEKFKGIFKGRKK